jgi:small conductance mechanosensitive channel
MVQMPNSAVVAANIINYNAEETRRVEVKVTASYDAPVEKVEAVLQEMVLRHEKVLRDPAPFARVSNYGASSIEYTIRVWCASDDYWDVYFDVTRDIKTAFDQNGIEMTYDHLNVHVVKE